MPKVLNLRTVTAEEEKNAVRIDRTTKWGNPFRIGRDGDRKEVVAKYAKSFGRSRLASQLDELRGKDLLCWCAPQLCHGDVLLMWANPGIPLDLVAAITKGEEDEDGTDGRNSE